MSEPTPPVETLPPQASVERRQALADARTEVEIKACSAQSAKHDLEMMMAAVEVATKAQQLASDVTKAADEGAERAHRQALEQKRHELELAKVETEIRALTTPPKASLWLVGGLATFGFTLGLIGGLSVQKGTSQVLLATVTTFLTGTLLTYAGFKRAGVPAGGYDLDGQRVGQAATCFCALLIVGAVIGARLRMRSELSEAPAGSAAPSGSASGSTTQGGGGKDWRKGLNLQADEVTTCDELGADLGDVDSLNKHTAEVYAAKLKSLEALCTKYKRCANVPRLPKPAEASPEARGATLARMFDAVCSP